MVFAHDSTLLGNRQVCESATRKLHQLRNQLPLADSALALTHPSAAERQRIRDMARMASRAE